MGKCEREECAEKRRFRMLESKNLLIGQLRVQVETELAAAEKSAAMAQETATHAESKPENKYDTRGLEASYLAAAQKERVSELRAALALIDSVRVRRFGADDKIAPTAFLELESDGQRSWCFLMPCGAGMMLAVEGRRVLTLTPQSPLGRAVLGRREGDVVTVEVGHVSKEYEIVRVS